MRCNHCAACNNYQCSLDMIAEAFPDNSIGCELESHEIKMMLSKQKEDNAAAEEDEDWRKYLTE